MTNVVETSKAALRHRRLGRGAAATLGMTGPDADV
jgi:hypothetical protein